MTEQEPQPQDAENARQGINAALKSFARYYVTLGVSIIVALLFSIFHMHVNTDITVAIFVFLWLLVFGLFHIMAVVYMPTTVHQARKAMGMRDIGGIGCLLQIISFFVFAWPMHILYIVHIRRLLKSRKEEGRISDTSKPTSGST